MCLLVQMDLMLHPTNQPGPGLANTFIKWYMISTLKLSSFLRLIKLVLIPKKV